MTQPADVIEQALSYVRHQASKSMADLAALMERTAADCTRCLEGVTEEQAALRFDQEWSIKEVLSHMLDSGKAVNEDIARLAEDGSPRPLTGAGETSSWNRPIRELRQALADQWAKTVRLTNSVSDEASRKPSLEHPTFGPLNGREWIAFQRLHAMDHVQQIEKVKAYPDYPRADLS